MTGWRQKQGLIPVEPFDEELHSLSIMFARCVMSKK
jgi:hypothetical protein